MTRDVVKVGGSLLDLPDLGARLRRFLHGLSGAQAIVVPGGGSVADFVRRLDQTHHLGEETSHWLSLRAMSFNAHVLAHLLPGAQIVSGPHEASVESRATLILDGYTFAREDERQSGSLPHCWDVTSDSLAVRAAVVFEARRLFLLKSCAIAPELGWEEASRQGFVDRHFARAVRQATDLHIEAIDFRRAAC